MKKLFQLIFVLTALMFIIMACKKNDVTEPKDGKEKTQIDDGKGTAPTGGGEGQIDENRGITTERLGTVSDVKEAKKQYLDHVDEAVDYLNGLLNATYAYKKEYFRSPDHADWYCEDYCNEDGSVIRRRSISDDGTYHFELYDKARDNRGAKWLQANGCEDLRNGYIQVATIDNNTDYYVFYIEYYYDDDGKLGEVTTYLYYLRYDVNEGYQVKPFSEWPFSGRKYSDIMSRYIYEYKKDSDGNTIRTDADGTFCCKIDENGEWKFADVSDLQRRFVFAPDGKLLSHVSDSWDGSGSGSYDEETWFYDEKGNLTEKRGILDYDYIEGWRYDEENRLISHSKTKFLSFYQKISDSYTYDDKGNLIQYGNTETVMDENYSHWTKDYENYGEEGNEFGLFAGMPYQSCYTNYKYDKEQEEWIPDGEKTYTYYNYVAYQQTINEAIE